jgi:hypothetical protein
VGGFQSGEHDPHIEIVGQRLVLVGGGGLEVWDLATRARVLRIPGLPPGHVEDDEEAFPGESEPHGSSKLRVAADGRTAISWGGFRNVTAWRLEAGTRGARFFHASEVTDAVLPHDGAVVISSAHEARELSVWDPITGALRRRLEHPPLVTPEALAGCTACLDARREWDDEGEHCAEHAALVGHNCAGGLALHPDGRLLVSGGGTGICAWDLERGWLGMMSNAGMAFQVAIAASGRVFAISEGREGRALWVWKRVGGEKIAEVLLGHPDMPVSAISPGPSDVLLHTQIAAELHDLDGAPLTSFEPSSGAWLRLPDGAHIVVEAHAPPLLIVSRLRDGQRSSAVDRPERSRLRAVGVDGLVVVTHGEEIVLYADTSDLGDDVA